MPVIFSEYRVFSPPFRKCSVLRPGYNITHLYLTMFENVHQYWKKRKSLRVIVIPQYRGLQTTARGPNAAREATSSGPRSQFVNNERILVYYYEKCVGLAEYNIPNQAHHARCLALEMLCTRLYGPRTKKFGDPCPSITNYNRGVTGPALQSDKNKHLFMRR